MRAGDEIVLAGAVRTPIGNFQGVFKDRKATELGAVVLGESLRRTGLNGDAVSEVLMGCVLPAGLGQAPARQAAIGGGLPQAVPSTTVSKVCGSGMKAIAIAADAVAAGNADVVLAGGMESMTNAPYLLAKARGGYRAGHDKIYDHMFLDGLEDAYERGRSMGTFAEATADHFGFTRAEQDGFATASLMRALAAGNEGRFAAEIIAVDGVDRDEQPGRAKPEKIPLLKPAFRADGTVTAANSSSISDGAAALLVARRSVADQRGIAPMAVLRGVAQHAQAPARFTTAPVSAISKLLDKVGWSVGDVDLFEINEAFAVVVLAAMRELGLAHEKVNVNGGACALGHPIGCSGARIVVTLLHALEARGLRRGVAAICIGGGEALALAVERP